MPRNNASRQRGGNAQRGAPSTRGGNAQRGARSQTAAPPQPAAVRGGRNATPSSPTAAALAAAFPTAITISDNDSEDSYGYYDDEYSDEYDDEYSDGDGEDGESSEYSYSDEYSDDHDIDMPFDQENLMNQLQTMLFNGAPGSAGPADVAQIRHIIEQQLTQEGGLFMPPLASAHSAQIKSIIRSLPRKADPMHIFSVLTELLELIVLTGEEIGPHEFDTAVDLKPLLPHLLRVLGWKEDCRAYGSDFLLLAVRCVRATVEYSERCASVLVEGGLVSLLILHIASVEYFEIAEAAIAVFVLLSHNKAHMRVCLEADAIRVLLGAVDFFSLTVQVAVYTATAHMCAVLTDATLPRWLPSETLEVLHRAITLNTTRGNQHDRRWVVHWALRALDVALRHAPTHAERIFPPPLVHTTLLPLAKTLPSEAAPVLARLTAASRTHVYAFLGQEEAVLAACSALLAHVTRDPAHLDEPLLVQLLAFVVPLLALGQRHTRVTELMRLVGRPMALPEQQPSPLNQPQSCPISLLAPLDALLLPLHVNDNLAPVTRHSLLLTLLLSAEVHVPLLMFSEHNSASPVYPSLQHVGAITTLLASADAFVVLIGIHWLELACRLAKHDMRLLARRHGVEIALISLTHRISDRASPLHGQPFASYASWLQRELQSLHGPREIPSPLSNYIATMTANMLKWLQLPPAAFLPGDVPSTLAIPSLTFNSLAELNRLLLAPSDQIFTEFELLGVESHLGWHYNTEPAAARILWLLQETSVTEAAVALSTAARDTLARLLQDAIGRHDFFLAASPPAKHDNLLSLLSSPLRMNVTINGNTVSIDVVDLVLRMGPLVAKMVGSVVPGSRAEVVVSDPENTIIDLTRWDETTTATGHSAPSRSRPHTVSDDLTIHMLAGKERVLLDRQWPLLQALHHVAGINGASHGDSEEERWHRFAAFWSTPPKLIITSGNHGTQSHSPAHPTSSIAIPSARLQLALSLLRALHRLAPDAPLVNASLSTKLARELDSAPLVACNAISAQWTWIVAKHPHLFPFSQRWALQQIRHFGTSRALFLLHGRLFPNSHARQGTHEASAADLLHAAELPPKRFRINRGRVKETLQRLVGGDARHSRDEGIFEFEYAEEMGSGPGPSKEFYALASRLFQHAPRQSLWHRTEDREDAEEQPLPPGGLFPSWTATDEPQFELMGGFVARAWLDSRIIDLPLHPLFIERLRATADGSGNENVRSLSPHSLHELQQIDPQLARTLSHPEALVESVSFVVPGSDIPLIANGAEVIVTVDTADDFVYRLLAHIDANTTRMAVAFRRGFNRVLPDFSALVAPFSVAELAALFSSASLDDVAEGESQSGRWAVETIRAALKCDYGYTPSSPQIGWIAELLAEPCDRASRAKLVQFLTGSSALPLGGWGALNPPLTVVSKTFDTPLNNPTAEQHDIHLPSVMTCASYLQLPRYSSKDVMRERLWYAIREGSDSFHLR